MLTAAQCEVIAYMVDGGIYCLDCGRHVDLGGSVEDAEVSRYALDEYQSESAVGWVYWDGADGYRVENGHEYALIDGTWHIEECGCCPPVECDECGAELLEAWYDYACGPSEEE